jgi:hypothetical protein
MKKQITLAIVVGMAVIATPVSFNAPHEDQAIVTLNSAEAKVGQPLSATSVAGVNWSAPRGVDGRDAFQLAICRACSSSNLTGLVYPSAEWRRLAL